MNKAYIYPISARFDKKHHNPYLNNFMNSLEKDFVFLNKNFPSKSGLFDILKYIAKINCVFLHWPENISEKKYGLIQSLFLFFLIPVFNFKKIKIIYVVHNKISHTKNNYVIKSLISQLLIKHSFIIVTHARDGITFIKNLAKNKKNIFYFPHPVSHEKPMQVNDKDIDVLIWGNIAPYKGVHRFIAQISRSKDCQLWKIVIAGKISSRDYHDELFSLKTPNIEIIDEYIDDNLLNDLINKSKIVLFPYHAETVLSSGVFAKSFVYPVEIIGPNCGSFSDFNHLDNVTVFENENEMVDIISSRLSLFDTKKTIFINDEIINKYSWQNFGKEFISEYYKTNNNLSPENYSVFDKRNLSGLY